MAFSYDLNTDVGKVRLLIMDNQSTAYLFEDGELSAFLLMEGDVVRRGAALALETMASNEAYVSKRIEILDLKTDGPAVAASLLKRAGELRSQADRDEQAEEGGAFDIAEWVVDDFSGRERLAKEWLRGG
jgi:hypothetical protein